jgi:hypothetical protein
LVVCLSALSLSLCPFPSLSFPKSLSICIFSCVSSPLSLFFCLFFPLYLSLCLFSFYIFLSISFSLHFLLYCMSPFCISPSKV